MKLKNISGTTGECLWKTVETPEGCTLIISGNGKMEDYVYDYELDANLMPAPVADSAPWVSRRNDIRNVIIEQGVKNIGDNAFCDCHNLTSVDIPASVTGIGDSAFRNCCNLTSAVILPSVTDIGDSAFSGCSSLTSMVIPPSVTDIGDSTFYDCNNLISVVIPPSVTSIGDNAFCGCCGLTSVVIPDSVTSIGQFAFCGCSSLTSAVLPDSLTSIGKSAFSRCNSRLPATIGITGECRWKTVETPDGCTLIIRGNGKMDDYVYEFELDANLIPTPAADSAPWISFRNDIKNVIIEQGVKNIGDDAFCDCCNLTSIVIPPSVTSIGDSAFYDCYNLISVVIPPSVTGIGDSAFYDCYSLTSINIPPSVTRIGEFAFSRCYRLTSVVIPASVTGIGYGVFYECSGLEIISVAEDNPEYTSVDNVLFSKDMTRLIVCSEQKCGNYVIPASVTRIADSAFSGCRRLRFISIPASVTSIGSEVFCECEDLEIICVAEDSPAYISVDSVLFNKDMTRLIAYPESKRGNYVIPASVTCIDDCAFLRCIYLTSVIIPESVWYIGDYAFACCIDLTSVVIPASVTDIGDGAFLNCDSMYWVTCMNTKPPKINSDVFGYCDMFDCLRTLRVPGSAIRAYRRAKGWKTFENIHPIQ